MSFTEQFHAILALPIGAAVLAFAICFFFCIAALVHVVIERKREHRARLRSLAARDDLIRAAERELAMRQRVYPKWVADKRMTQAAADHELQAMSQIVDTLAMIKRFETPIRDAVIRRLQDLREFELHPAVEAVRDVFPDVEIIIHDLPSGKAQEERPET